MAEPLSSAGKEKLEVLTSLYPIFKREVYKRREAMMRTAALGNLILLGLLFLVAARAPKTLMLAWLSLLGVFVFSAGLLHQIRQQKIRHTQAKAGLIRIEQALQLFTADVYLEGKSLYPESWQTAPEKDWVLRIAMFNVVSLTALVALALFFA